MTELERKALLGDREAQKQLTESGILLPCNCGGKAIRLAPPANYSYRVACEVCRMNTGGYKTQEEADSAWNRRPAPPIESAGIWGWSKAELYDEVEKLPAADVRPVVYADPVRIFNDPYTGRMFTTCSRCTGKISPKDKFCKHCGADLRGKGE